MAIAAAFLFFERGQLVNGGKKGEPVIAGDFTQIDLLHDLLLDAGNVQDLKDIGNLLFDAVQLVQAEDVG